MRELADERVDLLERERRRLASLEVVANGAVLGDAQLEHDRARVVGGHCAVLLRQREHAEDLADAVLVLAQVHGLAKGADAAARETSTRKQLGGLLRRLLGP